MAYVSLGWLLPLDMLWCMSTVRSERPTPHVIHVHRVAADVVGRRAQRRRARAPKVLELDIHVARRGVVGHRVRDADDVAGARHPRRVHVDAEDQAPSEALRIEGLAAKCGR